MNHATRVLSLWIANDAEASKKWNNAADALIEHAVVWEGIGGEIDYYVQETLRTDLARMIMQDTFNHKPTGMSEMNNELFNAALSQIQWYQIGKEIISQTLSLAHVREYV